MLNLKIYGSITHTQSCKSKSNIKFVMIKCNDRYFISCAKNPDKLLQEILAISPYNVVLYMVSEREESIDYTKEVKNRYTKKLKIGKWFQLSDIDLQKIQLEQMNQQKEGK